MYDMTRSRNRSGLEVKSVTLFACVTATVKFIKGAVVMDGSHFPSLVPERHSEFAVAAALKNAPDTCVTLVTLVTLAAMGTYEPRSREAAEREY